MLIKNSKMLQVEELDINQLDLEFLSIKQNFFQSINTEKEIVLADSLANLGQIEPVLVY